MAANGDKGRDWPVENLIAKALIQIDFHPNFAKANWQLRLGFLQSQYFNDLRFKVHKVHIPI
jgi:hypothetical protein